jgi:uncharacterized protein YraI
MIKNTVLFKLLLATTLLALVQMACSLPGTSTPAPAPGSGGVVKGVVYSDTNGNGVIDPGEGPLAGVQVSLAGCGAVLTQVTGADGSFNFNNLPAGSCQVTVTKSGWHFSGSIPSLGYPLPVASDPALPTAFSMDMAPDSTGTAASTAVSGATATTGLPPTDTFTLTPVTPTATATLAITATLGAPVVSATSVNANCRYGPGTNYSAVGALMVGPAVPILGTIPDQSWWQIDNPWSPGTKCWVASSVTTATGNLSAVPIVPAPTGLVTSVSVSTPSVVHGTCGGPNPTNFKVSVTTNGPATVIYHLEIYNGDGTLRNKTNDTTLTFAGADTQTFDPGGAYNTDCGANFKIMVLVTSPNKKTAQATWSVVSP